MTRRKAMLGAVAAASALSLIASAPASAATAPKKGGVFRANFQSPFDYVDPALTYYVPGWQYEYETGVKLMNYPDAPAPKGSDLVTEAAAAPPVISKDGKTYTFTVKKNAFKFAPPSNEWVTPGSFKAEFERVGDPQMQSPAQSFIANIVGAQDRIDGKAKSISGITTKGDKITFKLVQADPSFLAQIAMPFFMAVPKNTKDDPAGQVVPGAGPYTITSYTPGKQLVIGRNPNYKGSRPANLDKMIYTFGVEPAATELAVKSGQSDWAGDGVPPADYSGLWDSFGPTAAKSKSIPQQFFVNSSLSTYYLAMNTSRPTFANAKLRQAVNFAIDRPNIMKQSGAYAGKVTDQILPPGMPGYVDLKAYPTTGPDLAKAKSLAGNTNAQATLYTSTSPASALGAAVYQANLKAIGINVTIKQFPRGTQITKEGTKGEPFDLAAEGWGADYADPFDFINILLDGTTIRDSNNNNYSYFNDPSYNKKMADAAKLSGTARYTAYQKLDADLTQNAAPWASVRNGSVRDFFSKNIGGQTFQPIYEMDLGMLFHR